ncbi:MAG: PhnD/SsuA/transferrin family substrate-binding protein [Ectothiorhodospiraceae bacterium]|jgi:PAS domain S-box-containing protein/putative nucleotidyltransferase with HDIG domain|nr:PhnD/SsuA/transferrin family substrate-binding protein [Ectothiorhodospiraceae bacterium]
MHSFWHRIILLGCLLLAALGCPPGALADDEVRIGVLAKRGTEQAVDAWQATADYLNDRIPDRRFVIVPLDFRQPFVQVAEAGVDFVLANSFFYTEMEARYGARRLVTLLNRVGDGIYSDFGGVVFTRVDRVDLQTFRDLRRRRFMAVDEYSFGGHLAALREIHRAGLNPERDFDLSFGGTHDAVVYAVRDGLVDAGTVRTDTLERMAAEGKIELSDYRVIEPRRHPGFELLCSTELYPEWPFAALPHTPEELAREVATALLAMPVDSEAARRGGNAGWTTPRNYEPVHDLMRELHVGAYTEYGMVGLAEVWRQYWPWFVGGVSLLLVFGVGGVVALCMNRRIARADAALREAHALLERRVEERTAELREALAELEESRRRETLAMRDWHDAFDAIADPVFIHDAGMCLVHANPAYVERAGQSMAEIEGHPYWEVFPRLDGPLPECRHLGGTAVSEVVQGAAVYLSRSFGIEGEDGGMRYAIHVLEDVTEERRSKASLLEAQRIARLGNWDWDIVGGHLSWSDEIYRIFGLEPQQFAATYEAFLDRVHPDDREAVQAAVDRALRREQTYAIDHRILLPNGRERVVHERGEVSFDADGRPVHMLGTVQDVTEVRHAERELRRLNRALRTISRGNEVLVRATEEQQLLDDVCEVLIRNGGYRMTWVGYPVQEGTVQAGAEALRPIAWAAGEPDATVPATRLLEADADPGVLAWQRGEPVIVGDVDVMPDGVTVSGQWREEARWHHCGSIMALPLRENGTTLGALSICAAAPNAFDDAEVALLTELANDLAFGIAAMRTRRQREVAENERLRIAADLERALVQTIQAIALTVEKRDPYTAGHQQRVAELAVTIAHAMDLPPQRLQGLRLGAEIHDIGKIYVPAEFLSRPGKLSDAEFDIIKAHPVVGHEIIKGVEFPWPVADVVVQHHERLDGSGYPHGLQGDEICLEARILAVADVVEAMASHRPYRPALPLSAALEEIEQGRGLRYDPQVVDICLRLFRDGNFTFSSPHA